MQGLSGGKACGIDGFGEVIPHKALRGGISKVYLQENLVNFWQ